MMPLIKCCAASSGGLTAKTASVAKGIRQTASQRMISGLDMVCNQFKIIGRGRLFMSDFPTLMDFLVAEIVGNGLFGNVFDGVLFRYRIVQDEAAQVVGEVQNAV